LFEGLNVKTFPPAAGGLSSRVQKLQIRNKGCCRIAGRMLRWYNNRKERGYYTLKDDCISRSMISKPETGIALRVGRRHSRGRFTRFVYFVRMSPVRLRSITAPAPKMSIMRSSNSQKSEIFKTHRRFFFAESACGRRCADYADK
jgi:hypothetical protein